MASTASGPEVLKCEFQLLGRVRITSEMRAWLFSASNVQGLLCSYLFNSGLPFLSLLQP